MIGEDGRMTEAAGRFAGHDRRRGARGRGRGARAGGADRQAGALHATRCRSPTAPAQRIEPLISLQWFMRMDELAAPAIEAVRSGRSPLPSRALGEGVPRLAREHPAVVHLAPAVVGAPAAGLVLRRVRGDLRRHAAARALRHLRRRAAPRRGRARHVVLLGAVAVRDARVAARHAGAARLLPDRRARHGAGHHLPVGRAHGDDGPRVPAATSRSRTSSSPRSSRRPTVAGCRSRSARASTRWTRSRRTARTRCASACWRCRRRRTCATRPRRSSRDSSSPTRCGTRRGWC